MSIKTRQAFWNIALGNNTKLANLAKLAIKEAEEEALAKQEQGEQNTLAYREAADLANWLFKKHYAHEEHYASGRSVWGLCDTTAGVISQIDNMVCKLVREQEQGEPVARCRVFPLRGDESIARHYIDWVNGPVAGDLYTTPQQRTWVGLSDEDYQVLREGVVKQGKPLHWMIKHIDAKLKEKNT